MRKPDDIPQDAWDKAASCEEIYRQTGSFDLMQDAIARAIMAAKAEAYEDAAKMIEAEMDGYVSNDPELAGLKVSVEIIRTKASEVMK